MKTKSALPRRPRTNGQHRARLLGQLHGRPVYSFPVQVTHGQDAALWQIHSYPKDLFHVTAHSARDAANLICSEFRTEPCVQVEVYGPQGGLACQRYWTWDSAVYYGMDLAAQERHQLRLNLNAAA